MPNFMAESQMEVEDEANPTNRSMPAAWMNEMSADRYRPMMRLLDEEDFEFLRSQPGVTARQVARLRAQRCRIFRDYLHSLNADFRRVAMALKVVIAESGEDRADLAGLLLRRQAQFAWTMIRVQCRLVLFTWGMGRVDVSDLVDLFDGIRLELMSMAPAAA
jgi:hypothetical protein